MKTFMTLVALIGLAACGGGETLAIPTGPVFALNIGHWHPAPADLQLPGPGGIK
jgi:hypothetical protein